MQILLRDTRRSARFPTEHLAALIKPHLINSDKGGKIEGVKEEELEEIYNPDADFFKKKKKSRREGRWWTGKLRSTL